MAELSDDLAQLRKGMGTVQVQGPNNPSRVQGKKTLTADGSIRERPLEMPPDETYLSPAFLKEAGMQDGEFPYWARDSKVWQKQGEIGDNLSQKMHQYPGARLPDRDIRLGEDCRLMFFPKEVQEAQTAFYDRAKEEWEKQFKYDSQTNAMRSRQRKDGLTGEEYRGHTAEDVEGQYEEYSRSGMIGPTAGMSLAQAYSTFSIDQIEADEAKARRGGRMPSQRWGDVLERAYAAERGTKSFGVGETGLGTTTQAKVRQRATAGRQAAGSATRGGR